MLEAFGTLSYVILAVLGGVIGGFVVLSVSFATAMHFQGLTYAVWDNLPLAIFLGLCYYATGFFSVLGPALILVYIKVKPEYDARARLKSAPTRPYKVVLKEYIQDVKRRGVIA